MGRLESLSALRKSPVTAREAQGKVALFQGFGPLGAHALSHFLPVGFIAGVYDGEEVDAHARGRWGATVLTYEKYKGVRHTTGSLFDEYFYHDHGDDAARAIAKLEGDKIFVPFNATPALEKFLFEKTKDVYLAQNPDVVRRFFEDKMRLALHAQEIRVPLPPAARVSLFGQISYDELSQAYPRGFVLQIPFSQQGGGTDFVFARDEYEKILELRQTQFAEAFDRTQVKITPYLNGPSLNCTACVCHGGVALSPPNVQLVGDPRFINIPGAYIGSDFSFPMEEGTRDEILEITRRVGVWLGAHGYRGNYGVDLLSEMDSEGRIQNVCISEINARLVGESQYMGDFESMMDIVPLPFFHLAEFLRWEVSAGEIEAYNRSIRSVRGSALILYTREKGIFRAAGGLRSGVYRIEGERLVRKGDGWTLSDSNHEDDIVVTNGVPTPDLVIGHPRYGDEGIALFYLMTRDSILDPKNPKRVNDKWVRIARIAEAAAGLVPTEPKSLREG